MAIENHLVSQQDNPELTGRAQAVLEEIERESQARQAAIATLFGKADQRSGTGGSVENSGNDTKPTPPTTKSAGGKASSH